MKRWVTFLNERVPIPLLLTISGGISASEVHLTGRFDRRAFLLGGFVCP